MTNYTVKNLNNPIDLTFVHNNDSIVVLKPYKNTGLYLCYHINSKKEILLKDTNIKTN